VTRPPDRPRGRRSLRAAAAVIVAAVLGLAGCASPNFAQVAGGVDTTNTTLVMFMPSTANVYLAAVAEAARAEATAHGYRLTVIENNFDQAEQDQQVQQYLATGARPASFLWWPATSAAGVNSNRQLAQVAPVIQFNQAVGPAAEPVVKAYAGVSDIGIGQTAGAEALAARQAALAAGLQLRSPGGNLIEFGFSAGYQAGVERHNAFVDATRSAPFNLLHNEPAGFDAQAGFAAASQIIPKYLPQGIDFVYCQNNDLCVGVATALRQSGLAPGRDVYLVTGNYSGDKQPLKDGLIYSSVVQSPVIEGKLVVRTALQYLRTGDVQDGTVVVPADPADPGLQPDAPHRTTYMPNPSLTPQNVGQLQIWGMNVDQLMP
jgi:ABC-type sugar transport system substrate-binding protein